METPANARVWLFFAKPDCLVMHSALIEDFQRIAPPLKIIADAERDGKIPRADIPGF